MSVDYLLFAVLPYLALAVCCVMALHRYTARPFSYSSLSSQFLENRHHFWGSVPFHYGIITILMGHFVAFLFPRELLAWNGRPVRLYILEVTALVFGLLALVGLVNVVGRRIMDSRPRHVTSTSDWVLFGLLSVQIGTGVATAAFYGWGSSWFAASAVPYLWSLALLSPDVAYMAPMPWTVKAHVICAFALVAYLPFTRLVHVLVAPIPYLWRRPQVVRWYWDRRRRAIS